MDIQLPETQLTNEDDETEDLSELLPDLYVERLTGLLYEVKFFDGFCLIRPATPTFYLAIKKMSHTAFVNDFEEFNGDKEAAREFIRNAPPDFIIN